MAAGVLSLSEGGGSRTHTHTPWGCVDDPPPAPPPTHTTPATTPRLLFLIGRGVAAGLRTPSRAPPGRPCGQTPLVQRAAGAAGPPPTVGSHDPDGGPVTAGGGGGWRWQKKKRRCPTPPDASSARVDFSPPPAVTAAHQSRRPQSVWVSGVRVGEVGEGGGVRCGACPRAASRAPRRRLPKEGAGATGAKTIGPRPASQRRPAPTGLWTFPPQHYENGPFSGADQ